MSCNCNSSDERQQALLKKFQDRKKTIKVENAPTTIDTKGDLSFRNFVEKKESGTPKIFF